MENLNQNQFLKTKYNQIKILKNDKIKLVYLAERIKDNEKVIIKEINLENLKENEKLIISQEGMSLTEFHNTNIINLFEFFIENKKAYIITEYAENGNLSNKIQKQKDKNETFDEKDIIEWIIDICEGLKFIHENNIKHKDLKLNNLFVTKNNNIKLGNFGIEKSINSKNEDKESLMYLSPEKIKGEECDNKTDIWNLGIILYELTQLCHPFFDEEINIETIKENIEKVDLLEFININYSARLLNLIKSLFILDPNKRPEINKILLESYTILIKRDSHSKRK